MRIAFKNFGCRANSVDMDILQAQAKARGHEIVPDSDPADAYVINSCTVTHLADRDARNQARKFKALNPNAKVGIAGCYAQIAADAIEKLPYFDFIVGTSDKTRILDFFEKGGEKNQVTETRGFLPEKFFGSRRSRAAVKIQDGCNYSCSFCIIPKARGRSRSLAEALILNQIDEAYQQGFQEVVLTGIHLATYGWDQNTDLVQLLRKIFEKKNGPRIRLSTLDPFEIPDTLIEIFANEPRLCPHFHIALQSGSDSILKKMQRFYHASEFTSVCEKIKNTRPETFIGVDVIVGFPTETDADFHETEKVLESSPWTKLHVFSYSDRNDTKASNLSEKVSKSEIQLRSEKLRAMSEFRYSTFLNRLMGERRETILERLSSRFPEFWIGHTEDYVPTLLKDNRFQAKQKVTVRIADRLDDKVFTEAIDFMH